MQRWLGAHILAAALLRKPVVLEEFGVAAANSDAARAAVRDPVFRCVAAGCEFSARYH